jgi:hypothetical protein
MPAVLTSVMTTGPTYRLQLKLLQGDAEVEAEMAKSRFDALGLAPGASVRLRPLEFGLFSADPAVPELVTPIALDHPRAAVA